MRHTRDPCRPVISRDYSVRR